MCVCLWMSVLLFFSAWIRFWWNFINMSMSLYVCLSVCLSLCEYMSRFFSLHYSPFETDYNDAWWMCWTLSLSWIVKLVQTVRRLSASDSSLIYCNRSLLLAASILGGAGGLPLPCGTKHLLNWRYKSSPDRINTNKTHTAIPTKNRNTHTQTSMQSQVNNARNNTKWKQHLISHVSKGGRKWIALDIYFT